MKCNHNRKKFVRILDYRGYPEKLEICEECGMTIIDYVSDQEMDLMKAQPFDPPPGSREDQPGSDLHKVGLD